MCVLSFVVSGIQLVCKMGENRRGRKTGVSEGFMGVIMESQWQGHWHWDIFSHPPPIIRWMEQEGVSTATYGRGRMACCGVWAQITYVVVFLPLYHAGNYMHQATLNDSLNPFHTNWCHQKNLLFYCLQTQFAICLGWVKCYWLQPGKHLQYVRSSFLLATALQAWRTKLSKHVAQWCTMPSWYGSDHCEVWVSDTVRPLLYCPKEKTRGLNFSCVACWLSLTVVLSKGSVMSGCPYRCWTLSCTTPGKLILCMTTRGCFVTM